MTGTPRHIRTGITAVLYDVDGTIINSIPTLELLVAEVCDAHEAPVTLAQIRGCRGIGLREMYLRLHPERADEMAAMHREHEPLFHGAMSPFPEAPAVLVAQHDADLRLGAVTNRLTRSAKHLLDAHRLRPLLRCTVGRDCARAEKPDPAGILLGLRALRVPPEQAVYIGDSVADVLAANAAQVFSIAVARSDDAARELRDAQPSALVGDLREAHELIRALRYVARPSSVWAARRARRPVSR